MATVTALADRLSQITGLQSTGTERVLALQALNNSYQRAIAEAGSYRAVSSTLSLTSGTADYDIASAPISITDCLGIKAITFTGGGLTNTQGTRVSESQMIQMREGASSSGSPVMYYAVAGDTSLMLHPTPGSSSTCKVYYVKAPPTLVESAPAAGEETTPSKIPARFHWDLLLPGAVAECLDKDQRLEDASMWMQRAGQGLMSYIEHVTRFGGDPGSLWSSDSEIRYNPDYYGAR